MYWIIYILSVLLLNYLFVRNIKRRKVELFLLFSVILITPTTVDTSSSILAPAVSVFFYDLTLELEFTLRPLRSLVLSLPITILLIIFVRIIRKRLSR